MKSEIVEAFNQIVKDKNIDKELLSEILESIMYSVVKKKYGTAENFNVFVSMDKGEIEISQSRLIVDQVTDENLEIKGYINLPMTSFYYFAFGDPNINVRTFVPI